MNLILIIPALFLLSWIVLGALFLGYPTVQRLKHDHYDEIGWFIKVPAYVAVFVGLIADVLFNATWGTVVFRELPKEFLFTDRLKRHWRGTDEVQKNRAAPWVKRVNLIDPGHV